MSDRYVDLLNYQLLTLIKLILYLVTDIVYIYSKKCEFIFNI